MSGLGALFPALLLGALLLAGLVRGVDVYAALLVGARKGLRVCVQLLPPLLVLFPALYLLRASGLPEMLGAILSPLFSALGVPTETALLLLLRPLSGSGAMAAASELIARHGPDSLVGRTAAVMLGSSETTLYVAAVYFSAAGVKNSRWAIPAALFADLCCFLSSAWLCRLFWG